MINRLKAILADFFQQADLMLLGLCSSATVFGILLIFSAYIAETYIFKL